MSARLRYATRIFAANVAASILVAFAFAGVSFGTPWRIALSSFGIAFLFSSCIGIPVAVILPKLGPYFWTRFRFPVNWFIAIVVMMAISVAGSALAIVMLIALRILRPSDFSEWFTGSIRISIITTLTIGIAVTAYELMRARLEEASLALRTKERDEAEARRLANEAQLSSLEARVQPHFLFNTLNSIAALIPRDPAGAERMTGQLASLMRSSLDSSASPLVPLDQELSMIRDYLDIERVRFGARLRYHVEVDDQAMKALVPRLSLQTLVENSVKYAVSPRREGGSISIRARHDGALFRYEVEDDGPGFDGTQLPQNHGLATLKARLAMMFGEQATMIVRRRENRTVVAIEIEARSP